MSVNLCRYEAQNISFSDLEKLGNKIYYEIKYDGTHVCLKYENELKINTRNDIPHEKSYQNLFYQVPNIDEIINYIKKNNQFIIHGELVHKKTSGMQIHTNETPQFIIYDIFNKEKNKYLIPSKVDNEIFSWYPLIYFDTKDILDRILKSRLEGLVAKIYNENVENCEPRSGERSEAVKAERSEAVKAERSKKGQNFNLCVFKYKPFYATLGVIFKPVRKEIDVKKLSFLLGEIDNDLKYNKNNWHQNHPELLKFLVSNKEKIIKILQNQNILLQIEKDTHLDINKIKEYITNFKE